MSESLSFHSVIDISKSSLKAFDCGIEPLNIFLSRYAQKNDTLGIGKTFVASCNRKIAGYFTLATAQLAYEEIPADFQGKLPKYPIPSLRIARLAVDKNFQGKGIGKLLLKQAFLKVLQVAEVTGLYFVIVDAKETSKSFYEKYGFIKLSENNLTYFIPVETVKQAAQPLILPLH